MGVKLQYLGNKRGRGGLLTRAKFGVGYLACDKPADKYLKPELPHSSNVNELLPDKGPLTVLIPRPQTKPDRFHGRLSTN